MDFSNPNKNNEHIKNSLILLHLILNSEKQIRAGKTTDQKDVFIRIENKYFNEDDATTRSINV